MKGLLPLRGSVRRKTMTVVLLTTTVALLVHSAVLLFYEARSLRDAHLSNLLTQAEIVGRASGPALTFDDVAEAEEDLALLKAREDIEAAAIYDADGRIFADYARPGEERPPALAGSLGHSLRADRLSLFHPIVENGESVGTVYLRSRSGFRARMVSYLGTVAAMLALAMAVAWALSSWLQRSLTQPIVAVAAAARDVFQRRDFSIRAPKSTEDEIGQLADALNRMLADLEREMSERHEAESALKAADRRKDEFLATLAHELRNPLAPIRNALYLLRQRRDDRAVADEALAIIERQLGQLVRLVEDLLDVSRITTGKLALRRERVDARAVAASALEVIEPMVKLRSQRLTVELPPAGSIIDVDPTRLAQVFSNLLHNAVKFTPEHGAIEFRVVVEDGELRATVRDDGVGLAPEMLEDIFKMFAQVDRSLERSTSGLGVGLSLSRQLVELHGGTLHAQSAGVGKGAEFILRMPTTNDEFQTVTSPVQRLPVGASRTGGWRILLADDNVDFVESLAILLRGMGNEVRVEHDGVAAAAAAREFRPEVAFLDIGLPKMNGFDLARRLRSQPETEGAKLVAVTGWGQPADRARARDAGFDDYVVKPLEATRLEAILAEAAAARG